MKIYDRANHIGRERRRRPDRHPKPEPEEQPIGNSLDGYNAGVWMSRANGDTKKRMAIAEQIVLEVARNGIR